MRKTQLHMISLALLMTPGASYAQETQNVTFDASVADSCILTVTDGKLSLSQSGKLLGSEEPGGSAAFLFLYSSGNPPKLVFDAPALTSSPAQFVPDAVEISYYSGNRFVQAYTSALSSVQEEDLVDDFVVHARVLHETGFPAGDYEVMTVATCGAEPPVGST